MKVATFAEKINNPVIGYVFFLQCSQTSIRINMIFMFMKIYVLKIGYTSYNMKTIH